MARNGQKIEGPTFWALEGSTEQKYVKLYFIHKGIKSFYVIFFPAITKSVADNNGQKWPKIAKNSQNVKVQRFELY